ncbi:MAG: acyl-CoA thioesterase [Bacteroidales bacterium]|jgi:acyl-CoA thioester hydrolase|nr:acyl-CoA thioesterase [Bacteroidales bacterium]
MKRPMQVQQDIHIKAYEIDSMGIVSNIVYIKWFEDLRHLWLEKYYPYKDMMAEKKSPMLMRTEVDYKKPLTILDFPVGKTWMEKLGRTKWEMGFEISINDIVYCAGKQIGCFFDIEKNSITAFPDRMLEVYNNEKCDELGAGW